MASSTEGKPNDLNDGMNVHVIDKRRKYAERQRKYAALKKQNETKEEALECKRKRNERQKEYRHAKKQHKGILLFLLFVH